MGPPELSGERAVMARSLVYLYLAGGTLTLLLFLTLPRPEASVPGMLAVIGAAYALAAGALVAFNRLPHWSFPVTGAFSHATWVIDKNEA